MKGITGNYGDCAACELLAHHNACAGSGNRVEPIHQRRGQHFAHNHSPARRLSAQFKLSAEYNDPAFRAFPVCH
jgi:hypothetical protein